MQAFTSREIFLRHPPMEQQPKSVALQAIDVLFVQRDMKSFEAFVAQDGVHKNGAPGSALEKLRRYQERNQRPEELHLSRIEFFRAEDIDRLESEYPHKLWFRVRDHIGDSLGVLIGIALSGVRRDRAIKLGEDPANVAMVTWVLSDDDPPKIVHVDSS